MPPMPDQQPWLIAIAASAGGIQALKKLLAALPADLCAAVVVVQHRNPAIQSYLPEILRRTTEMAVVNAHDGARIEPGFIYIARPDLHLTVAPGGEFLHVDGTRVRGVLSSANPLLESAATVFQGRTIAVVLTGSGMDATDGVQTVRAHGGVVIAQDPSTADYVGMPAAAIKSGAVDYVLPIDSIAPTLAAIVRGERPAAAAQTTG